MNDVLQKPLSYNNLKIVFRHLDFGKRKQLRKCLRKQQRRVLDDSLPYHFSSLSVQLADNGNVEIELNRYEDGGNYCVWEFSNAQITRKLHTWTGTLEQVSATEKTIEENVKQWMEFYLNRNSTKINKLSIKYIPAGLELTTLITVNIMDISVTRDVTNFMRHISPQLEVLQFGAYQEHLPSCDAVFSAKNVSCHLHNEQQLDWVYRLTAVNIALGTKWYRGDAAILTSFLKEFALRTRPMNSELIWEGKNGDLTAPSFLAIRDDSANGWAKKFMLNRECATLTVDNHEVNVRLDLHVLHLKFMPIGSASDKAPPNLKLRFDLAFQIFSHLPYPSRVKLIEKIPVLENYTTSPCHVENLLLKCRDGDIFEASFDGQLVEKSYYMLCCLKRSYVKTLIIEGVWNGSFVRNCQVDNLILNSQEPFPQKLANIFLRGNYPKMIFANNPETIRNIREITENADVTFTDTMASNEAADEPPAKRARVE